LESGEWKEAGEGTPQGAGISPLLANIFLHYVLDLWVHRRRQRAQGCVSIVRYADDFVLGFESETHFAGLDVSLETTTICVVDDQGGVIFEGWVATDPRSRPPWRRMRQVVLGWKPGRCRSGYTQAWRGMVSSQCSWRPPSSCHAQGGGAPRRRRPGGAGPRRLPLRISYNAPG
jgi:hypothetical protein